MALEIKRLAAKNRSLCLMQSVLFTLFYFVLSFSIKAQEIDVLHYSYQLELKDENDQINGHAEVKFRLLQPASTISFDLVQLQENGKGIKVSGVLGEHVQQYRQGDNKLYI